MAETKYAARFRKVVAACRARGITVIEEPDCYSRTVGQGTSKAKDFIAVRSHVPHHTAGGNDSSDRRVVRDGRTGLRGPLSQFLTETDGVLRLLASGYSNHAGPTKRRYEGNSYSVGNEIVSRGRSSKDFTAAQVRTAEVLAEELAREFDYDLDDWTVGHKEIAVPAGRKVDPAFSMPAFRTRLSLTGAGAPTPAPEEDDDMTPEQAERQARTEHKVDTLHEKVEELAKVLADTRGHAKTTREFFQPGGLQYRRIENIEAVAARGKNLTIEVLAGLAVIAAGVTAVPAQTVRALIERLTRAADDEPPATTTPDRDEQEASR